MASNRDVEEQRRLVARLRKKTTEATRALSAFSGAANDAAKLAEAATTAAEVVAAAATAATKFAAELVTELATAPEVPPCETPTPIPELFLSGPAFDAEVVDVEPTTNLDGWLEAIRTSEKTIKKNLGTKLKAAETKLQSDLADLAAAEGALKATEDDSAAMQEPVSESGFRRGRRRARS